jgi:hypothetical protein
LKKLYSFIILRKIFNQYIFLIFASLSLSACSTVLAVADVAGTTVVYGVKTVVNTIDAITPDIVNKEK